MAPSLAVHPQVLIAAQS